MRVVALVLAVTLTLQIKVRGPGVICRCAHFVRRGCAGDVLSSSAGFSSYSGQSTLPSVGSREAALARQQQLQEERARARMGGGESGVSHDHAYGVWHQLATASSSGTRWVTIKVFAGGLMANRRGLDSQAAFGGGGFGVQQFSAPGANSSLGAPQFGAGGFGGQSSAPLGDFSNPRSTHVPSPEPEPEQYQQQAAATSQQPAQS